MEDKPAEIVAEEAPKPAGRFVKGGAGGPGRGKRGPQKGSEQAPRILSDLRWAYKHARDQVKGTAQQEDFRKMYREDHGAFLNLLTKHEQLHGSKKAAKQAAEVPVAGTGLPADPGEERVLDLVGRLLEEWEGSR